MSAGLPYKETMKSDKGFTLIEITVSLLLMSIIMAFLFSMIHGYIKYQKHKITVDRLDSISQELEQFRILNGRYPCPASLTTAFGDENFGQELFCEGNQAVSNICDDTGVCQFRGERVLDELTSRVSGDEKQKTPGLAAVRIGMIPARALGLDDQMTIDGYGNRFLYAVTENMAVKTPKQFDGGAILILDENDNRLLDGRGHASIVILSHGPDEAGGYNKQGHRHGKDCSDKPQNALDRENCDYSNAIFRNVEKSFNPDANFDDYIFFTYSHASPKWQPLYNTQGDLIRRHADHATVTIGAQQIAQDIKKTYEETDQADLLPRVEVHGNIRVAEQALSQQVCNPFIDDCFVTDVIAGEGMQCDDENAVMDGIAYSKAQCDKEIKCPLGTFFKGIHPGTKEMICEELPTQCQPQNLTVCGQRYELPATNEYMRLRIRSGHDYQATFHCYKSNWSPISSSGGCECVDTSRQFRESCGEGLEGYILVEEKTFCDGQGESIEVLENTCECASTTQQSDFPCSPGYSGRIIKERSFQCPDETWSEWRTVQDMCSRDFDDRP